MDNNIIQTCVYFALAVFLPVCHGGTELFRNAGMEDPDIVGAYGHAWGYSAIRVNTSHTGSYAVKLSNRTASWQGLGQDVHLQASSPYLVQAYVKQLNNISTKLWQHYRFTAAFQWTSDPKDKSYLDYGEHPFGTVQDGWFRLRGDFETPSRSWYSLNIYIQGPDPGIDFLLDDFSLQLIQVDTNWKVGANQRIEKLRKSNFTISVNISDHFDPHHVELEIVHRKHEFAFGSVVNPEFILNPQYGRYQQLFYEFFNWATVGDYKWKYNKGTPTNPNYDQAVSATDELRRHGLKVRGHNMFWGVSHNTPAWVHNLTSDQLKQTIQERIQFMTALTRNKLEHWDINNELLHGQLYEEMTRDPVYSEKIFRMVHQADPQPKLFLNEYNVVAVGALTDDYVKQGNEFKKANCGLYGLGLQSHFKSNVAPTPVVLTRLDNLATTGLPLWVTELTLENSDENVRADWFDDALTMYFSHPSIEGIILWGFWDHGGTSPDGALVNGNNYYINAAGKRYLELVKSIWSTNIKTSMTSKSNQYNFRGFHGDYDVIVRYRGKPVQLKNFTLSKNDSGKHVVVNVDSSGDEITLPTMSPTSTPIQHVHHVTHDHTQTIGLASLTSGPDHMTCVTRFSGMSAVGDDKAAEVSCNSDEIMTGCSSRTLDGRSFRDGDLIVIQSNTPVCRAVNAWRSAAPVQAVAICCQKRGIQCAYMKAGPSGHGTEDQIEVTCPNGHFATGCTSYTYFGAMDGAFSNGSTCIAQNDGTNGVFTYGACCQIPSKTCSVRKSQEAGIRQGDIALVTCHPGEVLVGCSVYSDDGHTAGAMPYNNGTCTATNGLDRFPGEDSVIAVAVCC